MCTGHQTRDTAQLSTGAGKWQDQRGFREVSEVESRCSRLTASAAPRRLDRTGGNVHEGLFMILSSAPGRMNRLVPEGIAQGRAAGWTCTAHSAAVTPALAERTARTSAPTAWDRDLAYWPDPGADRMDWTPPPFPCPPRTIPAQPGRSAGRGLIGRQDATSWRSWHRNCRLNTPLCAPLQSR